MAFDGIITRAVVSELNGCLLNGRINKIFEPNKNEILLGIYACGKNYALNKMVFHPPKIARHHCNRKVHAKAHAFGTCCLACLFHAPFPFRKTFPAKSHAALFFPPHSPHKSR